MDNKQGLKWFDDSKDAEQYIIKICRVKPPNELTEDHYQGFYKGVIEPIDEYAKQYNSYCNGMVEEDNEGGGGGDDEEDVEMIRKTKEVTIVVSPSSQESNSRMTRQQEMELRKLLDNLDPDDKNKQTQTGKKLTRSHRAYIHSQYPNDSSSRIEQYDRLQAEYTQTETNSRANKNRMDKTIKTMKIQISEQLKQLHILYKKEEQRGFSVHEKNDPYFIKMNQLRTTINST